MTVIVENLLRNIYFMKANDDVNIDVINKIISMGIVRDWGGMDTGILGDRATS